MKSTSPPPDGAVPEPIPRRAFLKGAAAVAVTASGAAGAAAVAAEAPQQPTQPAARGYRETPHIRRYYQLARD